MVKLQILKKAKGSPAHGGGVRGDTHVARSSTFEGRFGRIFRSLPPATWSTDALAALGAAMTADPETVENRPDLPAAAPETDKHIQDDEENAGISAGYTYLGQFIDHDITFDPASSLEQQNDPNALVDFRTPRLDLDSLYGRGPGDQPYMYVGKKFRLGRPLSENNRPSKARDLPRFDDSFNAGAKRALIADKRNDENVIVSQLHAAMLQLHNKLVDQNPKLEFEEIQRLVRWHYQWIVVNDFLPKICGRHTVQSIWPGLGQSAPIWQHGPKFALYKWHESAFMPIEFSAAAYRFGHSMVRPIYRLNTHLQGGDNPEQATPDEKSAGLDGRFFIFAGVQKRGLNGFDEFPERWAIDWSLFFDINGSGSKGGKERAQPAYKFDTSLTNPLGFLPEFSNPVTAGPPLTVKKLQATQADSANPSNLALRNLLRGMSMGLPSGQDVALALGVKPIEDKNLKVGKAVLADWESNPTLTSVDASFEGSAPLWYYVLAEAQYEWVQRAKENPTGDATPLTLGTIGGRIVAETLIGLLWADGHSYLRQAPNWKPHDIHHMGDLLAFALA